MDFKPSELDYDQLADLLVAKTVEAKTLGDTLVEAESLFRYLEDMEKIVFDKNMPEYDAVEKVSIRDRERESRTTEEYINHIEALNDSRKKYLQARYNYTDVVRRHDDIQAILLKRFGSMT